MLYKNVLIILLSFRQLKNLYRNLKGNTLLNDIFCAELAITILY